MKNFMFSNPVIFAIAVLTVGVGIEPVFSAGVESTIDVHDTAADITARSAEDPYQEGWPQRILGDAYMWGGIVSPVGTNSLWSVLVLSSEDICCSPPSDSRQGDDRVMVDQTNTVHYCNKALPLGRYLHRAPYQDGWTGGRKCITAHSIPRCSFASVFSSWVSGC